MIDLEDEDAPPELIDVSELPENEKPQPEPTSSDLPRVPITLVTGTRSIPLYPSPLYVYA
ncbi:uncharacterized protein LDX57_002420 [Aspergillus melleus]|uniref:uncharacterized protein n=1 Tax=Aspergillus melleus TaxID=138277 RepID=UPI001E8E5F13|nr:uncharacterized protein LDX57_002420 [Aspergillus melleus]KAH8424676.1 hypothetical protein LDX57_002420 [Aspergillus melleus]